MAAFEGAPARGGALTLYTLALDEATRPLAPAAPLASVLDAIAAQPRPANALAGAAAAADAFIDRLAAHRPELALTFCLGGATSLESLAARQRVARMLLAHGSDEQLLAFAQTQAARPSPRVVTLEVETDDVGVTLTHAHEAQNTRYGGYGGYVPYGQPVKKGAKVVVPPASLAAGFGVGAGVLPGLIPTLPAVPALGSLLPALPAVSLPLLLPLPLPLPLPNGSRNGNNGNSRRRGTTRRRGRRGRRRNG